MAVFIFEEMIAVFTVGMPLAIAADQPAACVKIPRPPLAWH